ncbi:hypothetical protein AB6884_04485 [Carnobacterium maltaromaticum]|uniref:hypothetical protein n=1 Tax=Carnobacterium maltaromaticum TaxID=2751 RepID=UPI0039BE66D9
MAKTKEELKTVFVTGAKPTQADFADLIDACGDVNPTLATASKDGLLAKADFKKLEKLTGSTTLADVAEGADLPTVITAVNSIISVLKASGIAK